MLLYVSGRFGQSKRLALSVKQKCRLGLGKRFVRVSMSNGSYCFD